MEMLGLSLVENKSLLQGVQEFVVAEQVADDLERRRPVLSGLLRAAHEQGTRQNRGEDRV